MPGWFDAGGVPSFPRWPHPVFTTSQKLGSRRRHPHPSPRSTTLTIAVGHLSQSIDRGCSALIPDIGQLFVAQLSYVDVNTGLAANETGHRSQVGPTWIAPWQASLPVSAGRPRRGKGLEVPHIREKHRGVMKTAEDSISLVENVFSSQEGPVRK
jgi:hypothetical protein